MSLNAAAMEVLISKGMSAEDILKLMRAMEATPARSSNADRQARYRARKRNEDNVTRNVTAPPKEYISNPPEPQIAKAISTPLAETAERIVTAWNEAIVGTPLPKARELTKDRLKHLKARLAEHSEADVIQAIRGMVGSDWHSGKSGQWTEGNLGWLLKSPENFTKMLERSTAAAPAKPAMNPAEWQDYCMKTAKHFEDRGNQHEAAEWRRKARVDRPPGPAKPIGQYARAPMSDLDALIEQGKRFARPSA